MSYFDLWFRKRVRFYLAWALFLHGRMYKGICDTIGERLGWFGLDAGLGWLVFMISWRYEVEEHWALGFCEEWINDLMEERFWNTHWRDETIWWYLSLGIIQRYLWSTLFLSSSKQILKLSGFDWPLAFTFQITHLHEFPPHASPAVRACGIRRGSPSTWPSVTCR